MRVGLFEGVYQVSSKQGLKCNINRLKTNVFIYIISTKFYLNKIGRF